MTDEPTLSFEPGGDEPIRAPAPAEVPVLTQNGAVRTPSTPGRRPGTKNAKPAGPRAPAGRPPAPGTKKAADHKPAVVKIIKKVAASLLVTAKARNSPPLAADAIALLRVKDDLAECLDALAQESGWLATVLEKAGTIAPGVELAAIVTQVAVQISVNHSLVPLEMGKLLDAVDPRELLKAEGFTVEQVAEPETP